MATPTGLPVNKIVFCNKLVRDNMPDEVSRNGDRAAFRKLDADEYAIELRRKLGEEVMEYLENHSDVELGDVMNVVHALKNDVHNPAEVDAAANKKYDERGGFDERRFMIWYFVPGDKGGDNA